MKTSEINKCLIVDGHNLLFQMYYGMPARIIGKSGNPIQGVLGFIGALLKTIRVVNPNKVVVIFDNEHGSNRNEIVPEYKANRYINTEETDDIFEQLKHIQTALNYLKIKYAEVGIGYEADDVIAGYCLKYADEANLYIMSNDCDFFQLVNERVFIYKYRGKKSELIDEKRVREKFGVAPCRIVDYKSLVGDNSDNIKGVRGIGKKTGVRLINEFGNIDGILNNIELVKPPHIQNAIRESVDLIKKYESIIRLKSCDVLPFDIIEFDFIDNGVKTIDVLKGIGLM